MVFATSSTCRGCAQESLIWRVGAGITNWKLTLVCSWSPWIYTSSAFSEASCPAVVIQLLNQTLWHHRLQHAGLLCPPPSPGVCSDSLPLSQLSNYLLFSSVQFSHSAVSHPLWPHEPQHSRPLCLSPTPRVHRNPCPLSQWCIPTISSSVVHVSSCPQSFSVSGSFQMTQLFSSGGQSIRVSASISVLPMNIQDWWTCWISLQSKGLSRVFSNTTVQKQQFFGAQLSLWSNSHIHTWPLGKP